MASCKIHKDEEVTLFCKTCKTLVCTECVVGQHIAHNFLSVKKLASEARNKVSKAVENVKSNTIPKIQGMLKETRQTLTEHSKDGTVVVSGIDEQRDEFITQINKTREELLQEAEMRQSTDAKPLKDFEQNLEAVLRDADELLNDYSDDRRRAQNAIIIKLELDMVKKVLEMEKEIKYFPKVKENMFVPEKITLESVRCLFGEWELDIEPKVEVISEFQHNEAHDNDSIQALVSTDQSAWIATQQGHEIKHVDKKGRVIKALLFSSQISDIVLDNDGGLLVTPNGGSEEFQIKKVKPDGDIVTFVDMKPLRTNCICTSNTGHVYVGCIDGVNYDVTDKNTRSVMRLSRTGAVEQNYQYDDSGQRYFTLPEKIQENSNNDIWVRDRTANYNGRVVVIRQDGKLRFIYTAVRNNNITKDFYPYDITPAGNSSMLISDTYNNAIHVVDQNGTLLYFLGSKYQIEIYRPTAIDLERQHNQLWIGNLKGLIQVLRLKK